jgi:hydrogenase maturation factor
MTNLRFADNVVLFANSCGELQETVNEVTKLCTDAGLQIITQKTKVMTNITEIEIKLNGEALEYVPEYTHLGQLMSFQDNSGREIKRRI